MSNGLRIANDFAGSDIGAKIMAASADLGAPGIIVVEPGDGAISTPFTLLTGQRLALNDGTITTTHDGNSPTITLNAGCSVAGIGTRWGTKITEPLQGGGGYSTVITDVSSGIAGGPNDSQGPSNLLVENIQFVGVDGNTTHQDGTCVFANVSDVTIRNCFFNLTSTYACVAGGSPAGGFCAEGVYFCENKFFGVATQNIAVVNAINIVCDANLCIGGDVTRHATFIDFELNGPLDRLENFSITNNRIDARGGLPSGPGTGIHVAGGRLLSDTPSTKNANGGIISNNTILGGAIDESSAPVLAGGINITAATDVLVCDNYIRYCGQEGIGLNASDNCTIDDNDVVDCGPVGSVPITIGLAGARWCTVSNNRLSTQLGGGYYAGIDEISDVTFEQTCDFNEICDNRIYFSPAQSITNPDHELRVTLTGPNSREWNNRIGGQTFGGPPGVDTLNALAVGYIPGLRTGSTPAVALVLGQATRSDVQPLLYAYDPDSTDTPDGVTSVKTANNVGNGNYLLASQWLLLTSTERDALTSQQPGFTFFNYTTGKLQTWGGDSAWHDLW